MLHRLDLLFDGYRWYRRWRGGTWRFCTRFYEDGVSVGIWLHNQEPPYFIQVDRTEQY